MLDDLFKCPLNIAIDLLYRPITIYLEHEQYLFRLVFIPIPCFQVILYVCIWSSEILKILRDVWLVISSAGRSQHFYTLVHLPC